MIPALGAESVAASLQTGVPLPVAIRPPLTQAGAKVPVLGRAGSQGSARLEQAGQHGGRAREQGRPRPQGLVEQRERLTVGTLDQRAQTVGRGDLAAGVGRLAAEIGMVEPPFDPVADCLGPPEPRPR